MANAQQPTRRTRHVEMKHFAILQWTEDKFLKYIPTGTAENFADTLSKNTGSIKFHEHMDIIMGRRQPHYSKNNSKQNDTTCSSSFSVCRKLFIPNDITLQTFSIYEDEEFEFLQTREGVGT